MLSDNEWLSCWCYETKKQVDVKGKLEPESIAQILTVEHCSQEDDWKVFFFGYLIGKKREGNFKRSEKGQERCLKTRN